MSQSIFLSLPLELRESIYLSTIMFDLLHRDALYDEDARQSYCPYHEWEDDEAKLEDEKAVVAAPVLYGLPALFSVSRQVRAEAEKVMYLRCTLVWRYPGPSVSEDLKHIPSRNHQFIRSVEYYNWSCFHPSLELCDEIANLNQLLPNLRNLTLHLRFENSTSTSSSNPEEVAKGLDLLLGRILARVPNVVLSLWEDGWYGDECGASPQPSLGSIVSHLIVQEFFSKKHIRWYGWEEDHNWVDKIQDLNNPIMLMGRQHPARPRIHKDSVKA
ncbi:MAG: hypothetical protein Q9213_006824 [Squamulea squamosa]